MGDELHVQRLGDGDDTEEIAEAEWLEFVRESPDFVLQDELSTPSPTGERITMGGQGLAGWNGHPNVELVPFRWSHGVVTVSFGDEYAVVGALVVADALGATVVGDDGERYDEPLGIEHGVPAWEFPHPAEHRPDPRPLAAPIFDASPPIEDVAFRFDGGPTVWDRVLPWRRRQRRG